MRREDVRAGWVALLLQWKWDYFYTQTFREEVHPERAAKVFEVAMRKMARELFGAGWRRGSDKLIWVRGTEYQQRDVLHYHVLLQGKGLDTWQWKNWSRWCWEAMGFLKVEIPRSQSDVCAYLSKCVVRGGEIDVGTTPR